MKTIALFGGSFDPPHIGHEAIVTHLLNLKYIEKVVVMPTFLNPFKTDSHASSTQRLLWLTEIFSEYEKVEVSDFEVKQKKKTPTIETVEHLLQVYEKIYVVIGADNLHTLGMWESFEKLNKLVTFIVVSRDDIEIPDEYIKLDIKEDISSTYLRKHIDIHKLPEKCNKEIEKFYKEKNER